MWDDARQLNAIAITLFAITVLGLGWTAVLWLARQPALGIREVVVTSTLEHTNAAQLEAVIRDELTGTFFTLDLERARAQLRAVPWIRDVALRRQWPQRLEITVDEHEPFARWNDIGLVDTRGNVFVAQWSADLPRFEGPEGRTADMAARFRAWSGALEPLALTLDAVRLSPRGGWQLKTSGEAGTLTLELGRDEPDARLARFIAAHSRTLAPLARAGTRVEAVDLRYHNGFAARVPAFREKPAKPAA
jgi:cell division protein FtsQ